MRRIVSAVAVVLALLGGAAPPAAATDTAGTYVNPVWPGDFPDPFVLRVGTTYYAYSTASSAGTLPVVRSDDLANWTPVGDAMPDLASWVGPGHNWAPAVIQLGGRFVAYYTALDAAAGHQCIGVAVAASPTGPFVDDRDAPLICQVDRAGSIDPSPFLDDAGHPWLTWKSEGHFPGKPALIWSQPLTPDGTALAGSATPLLGADQAWELGIVEAPSMLRAAGRWFLFYSGNRFDTADYATAYAVCDGPAGPCRKPSLLPVLSRTAEVGGPGGAEAFTDSDGAVWLAYHAWTMPAVGYPTGRRSLRLDHVTFADGRPIVDGPSTTPIGVRRAERLAGVDRYATAAALSARTFAPGVPVAYVASGETFPDALAAAPAAGSAGGPVLLVTSTGVPQVTVDELARLHPQRVVVVGAAARRADLVDWVHRFTGAPVTTVAGRDRYETASALSAQTFPAGVGVAYVATGRSFPDALAAGAAGARQNGPVLLASDRLPVSAANELKRLRPAKVVVLGGTTAVPDTVVAGIRSLGLTVNRVAGVDRYATAAAISATTYPAGEPEVLVATGETFADALTAGVARTPLLLVGRGAVAAQVNAELDRLAGTVTVLGGEAAVTPRTFLELDRR